MNITLATLPNATSQAVFNQVVEHASQQRVKCIRANCLYRNGEGLKCFAGCLMSDEEYTPKMEPISWTGLIEDDMVPASHASLIIELQKIHDSFLPCHWGREFRRLAVGNRLEFDVEKFLQDMKGEL